MITKQQCPKAGTHPQHTGNDSMYVEHCCGYTVAKEIEPIIGTLRVGEKATLHSRRHIGMLQSCTPGDC